MNRSSVLGEAVFDAWRNFGVHGACHETVALESPQLLGEHFRRDAVEGALEIGKAARLSLEEQEYDVELPAASESRERRSYVRGGAVWAEAFLT